MTHLFGRFSSPSAPFHLPGAAFFMAALLAATCGVAYALATRDRGVVPRRRRRAPRRERADVIRSATQATFRDPSLLRYAVAYSPEIVR